jgi:hypothetical protein
MINEYWALATLKLPVMLLAFTLPGITNVCQHFQSLDVFPRLLAV